MEKNILLHIIATNKYDRYIDGVIESARKHFFKDDNLKIALYTDSEFFLNNNEENVFKFRIEHESWPGPTLKRFHYFDLAKDLIKSTDFSFYIDVDSLFVKDIDNKTLGIDEHFSGTIGTLHPGFYGKCGTPERRPESLAYIPYTSRNSYFCGGFFGGTSEHFCELITVLKNNIDTDLSRDIIAIWHDESHLNRYFLSNPPSIVLGLGFSCPEESRSRESHFMDPSIVFLDKEEHIKKEKGQNAE